MSEATVHLVVSDLFPHDAIGNFVLGVAVTLHRQDIPYRIFAERHAPNMPVAGRYSDFFQCVRPEDTLLYQLSNGDPAFPELMRATCKRIVYYHNITPGEFFRPAHASTADTLDAGRAMLSHLSVANAVYANSGWSLEEVVPYLQPGAVRGVMPPLTESSLAFLVQKHGMPDTTTPYLLTAGRIIPHKNTLWAVRLFVELRKKLPNFSLMVMGGGFGEYEAEVKQYAASTGPAAEAIRFTGAVSDETAASLFRRASGLVCASLHEGFGVPLVEAMAYEIPVFALDQPAVRETLGGAGMLLSENVVAGADRIANTLQENDAMCSLRQQGTARVEALRRAVVENTFWTTLQPGGCHVDQA